jgi:hypothetical protein
MWATLLGLFSGIISIFGRVLEYFKEERLVNQGKASEQAERAKEEILINRETTEILSQERTEEETIKRLESGTF